MRGLSTTPARRAGVAPVCYGRLRGTAGGGCRDPRYTAARTSTVAHAVARRGFLGRLARRVARPSQLTPEEQFRLLEVALRIKLRREGKPEDAITLQRPADLPAPLGTPVRQPRGPVVYGGARVGVGSAGRRR